MSPITEQITNIMLIHAHLPGLGRGGVRHVDTRGTVGPNAAMCNFVFRRLFLFFIFC